MSEDIWKRLAIDKAAAGNYGLPTASSALKALELANRRDVTWASSALDPLRKYDVTSGILSKINGLSAIDQLAAQSDVQRTLLDGSVGDLSRLASYKIDPGLTRAIEAAAASAKHYEALFRLPKTVELMRLADDGFSKIAMAQRVFGTAANLQQSMRAMQSPWLQSDALRSAAAFSELVAIGRGVTLMSPYDQALSDTIRHGLGDWRNAAIPPVDRLLPVADRTAYYVEQGYDVGLTDFTDAAFEESLQIGGLSSDEDVVEELGLDADQFDRGLARAQEAFVRLQRFEVEMRRFIEDVMTRAYGSKWMRQQLPAGMFEKWQEKKANAEVDGRDEAPLIQYADFTDYMAIMDRGDNWKLVFKPIFRRQENMRESFQRLFPVRIATMHARVVSPDDRLLLLVETRRLLKAIAGA